MPGPDAARDSAHDHDTLLRNADGSWKYSNALARESSPYLLQHAHNPVDWYPWGEAAFDLARREQKPIFLSVGYSTCYWCHVMERQVFENPQIAAQMNEQFVNVKVDREERPDVDDVYMAAVQLMTRRGGWPMSVFLTPPGREAEDTSGGNASRDDTSRDDTSRGDTSGGDTSGGGGDTSGGGGGLKPFWAGTYIPPEPQYGMPSFPQVLTSLSQAWQTQKQDVLEQADRVAEAVREHLGERDTSGPLGVELVQRAANQLLRSCDPTHGGFGSAPKFPQPGNLLFLLRVYRNNPNDDLWEAISHTLVRMGRGGMYDQVGGGFHRYSTDEKWLVPHFEKMLYDNGQLLEAYAIAQQTRPVESDADFYARIARETADYVLREMTDETGTFWSAQDAEVDAREGGNYVWTPEEVREALDDAELAELAIEMYGLDRGTNFQDPHQPDAAPTNVLYLPVALSELAAKHGMTTEAMIAARRRINEQLYKTRMQRKQPGTDDKVLVSWNGLMIAGLAMAGRELGEERYTTAAGRAAGWILEHMRTSDGGLLRTMRKGEAKIPAFLDDYAFLIHGLLELHRTQPQAQRWLEVAKELTQAAHERFSSENGGYYDTLADQADLFVRTRSTYDGALSSGNSQMVHNLLDLHELTQERGYLDQAVRDLRSLGQALQELGANMAHMQHALLRALELAPNLADEVEAVAAGDAAQRELPVSAAVEPGVIELKPGEAARFVVTLQVRDSFHINASRVRDDRLVPTQLRLEGSKGLELKVEYPEPVDRTFAFSAEAMPVYAGTVTLPATLRLTGADGDVSRARVTLTCQACDDRRCLPPQTFELPVRIRLAQ